MGVGNHGYIGQYIPYRITYFVSLISGVSFQQDDTERI